MYIHFSNYKIRYFLYSIVISDLITSDLPISPTHAQLLANHPNASRSPKCTCLLSSDRFWLTLRREGDVHARCILVGFKCCCATSGSQCRWDLASHIRFLNKLWSAEICLGSWDSALVAEICLGGKPIPSAFSTIYRTEQLWNGQSLAQTSDPRHENGDLFHYTSKSLPPQVDTNIYQSNI